MGDYWTTNVPKRDDQCRPTTDQQNADRGMQSVCRQCYATCDPTGSNGKFCLHHNSADVPNGDPSIVAENVSTMTLPSWDDLDADAQTYYSLDVMNTHSFWKADLLSNSIINWSIVEGPFDFQNTHIDDGDAGGL